MSAPSLLPLCHHLCSLHCLGSHNIFAKLPTPFYQALNGAEQQTVEGLLHSLGLGKYTITFKAEEVDMTALKQMGENDLKELGIPMRSLLMIVLTLKRLQYPGAYHVTDEKIYNLSANNKFRGFSEMGCDQGGPRKKILLALLPRSKRQP
ncbi:hypothetical protein Goari_006798 [Gossypium aridum]|uniref:SAM domain-containing protein n=1 Tax=Gossypium aridum TaxID=34290 RepID=A0A7J8XP23_GOSAI|nr:hypothetical protein [Gossypium aridum]